MEERSPFDVSFEEQLGLSTQQEIALQRMAYQIVGNTLDQIWQTTNYQAVILSGNNQEVIWSSSRIDDFPTDEEIAILGRKYGTAIYLFSHPIDCD